MRDSVSPENDLRLSGFVSFVGNSSMEVSIYVEAVPEGYQEAMKQDEELRLDPQWKTSILKSRNEPNPHRIILAKFLMVIS